MSFLLTAVLHLLCGVSIDRCSFVLVAICAILELTMKFCTPSGNPLDPKSVSSNVPVNVRTVIDSLNLEPQKRTYISCPKCFERYLVNQYPNKCTRKETPSSPPCGHVLYKWRTSRGVKSKVPKRLFKCQDIQDWIFQFLHHQGIDTGGKGSITQWVHAEYTVGSETICPTFTQQVKGGYFSKVPTKVPTG